MGPKRKTYNQNTYHVKQSKEERHPPACSRHESSRATRLQLMVRVYGVQVFQLLLPTPHTLKMQQGTQTSVTNHKLFKDATVIFFGSLEKQNKMQHWQIALNLA